MVSRNPYAKHTIFKNRYFHFFLKYTPFLQRTFQTKNKGFHKNGFYTIIYSKELKSWTAIKYAEDGTLLQEDSAVRVDCNSWVGQLQSKATFITTPETIPFTAATPSERIYISPSVFQHCLLRVAL